MNTLSMQPKLTKRFFDFKYHRLMGGFYIQLPLMMFLLLYSVEQHQLYFMTGVFTLAMYCFFTTLTTLKLSLFEEKISWAYKFFIYYPHLLLQTIFLFSSLPLVGNLIFFLLGGNRNWFFNSGGVIISLSALLSFYCIFIRRQWIKLSHHALPIFHHTSSTLTYKISHITDLHIGNLTSVKFLKKVVHKVNQQKSDLIVITGDLITVGDAFLDDIAKELAQLSSRDGVIITLGNHDYYCTSFDEFISILQSHNLKVLHNEHHMIEHGQHKLCVVGIAGIVDNIRAQEKAIASSIDLEKLAEKNQINILLAHDSSIFKSDATHLFSLVLSGHTHGGQLGIPFLYRRFNVARFFYPYTSGLFKKDAQRYLYVNTGIGVDTLPVRWGVSPEIAVFTLGH